MLQNGTSIMSQMISPRHNLRPTADNRQFIHHQSPSQSHRDRASPRVYQSSKAGQEVGGCGGPLKQRKVSVQQSSTKLLFNTAQLSTKKVVEITPAEESSSYSSPNCNQGKIGLPQEPLTARDSAKYFECKVGFTKREDSKLLTVQNLKHVMEQIQYTQRALQNCDQIVRTNKERVKQHWSQRIALKNQTSPRRCSSQLNTDIQGILLHQEASPSLGDQLPPQPEKLSLEAYNQPSGNIPLMRHFDYGGDDVPRFICSSSGYGKQNENRVSTVFFYDQSTSHQEDHLNNNHQPSAPDDPFNPSNSYFLKQRQSTVYDESHSQHYQRIS